MDIKLKIYSDYLCPWCYVGQGVVDQLKLEYDVSVEWSPYLLRPDMPPEGMEIDPYIRERMTESRQRLEEMAHTAGMEMVFSEHISNSRRALEATEYAKEHGKGEEFHGAVFHKLYGEGKDISKWDILRDSAQEVGLDADDMLHEIESDKYVAVLEEQLAKTTAIGITGVPTYILNDKYKIVGAQPLEAFKDVIARLESETKK